MAATEGKVREVRMLYLDDETDILFTIQKGLNAYGFSVDVKHDPLDVLRMDLNSYDIVLLDLRMPKLDGFQVYDAIKDKIDQSKTKVCFFSAFATYENTFYQKFPKWKKHCFISKPISVNVLASKLRMLLDDTDCQNFN